MNQIVLDTIVVVAAVLLAASAIIALYRIVRGPSILDRMIATDVVLAAIMCGLGGFMALSGRTDLLPVLVVLAMLGFVGSVSVSRYVSKSDSMTPGAEAGALSDFSSSDWHMPKDSTGETGTGETSAAGEGSGTGDATGTGARAEGKWPEDVARGIWDVPDGPDAVTVQEGEAPVRVGLDQGADPGAEAAEEAGPEARREASAADTGGEGEGTGPDPGPEDSDDAERTGPEPDDSQASGDSRGSDDSPGHDEEGGLR